MVFLLLLSCSDVKKKLIYPVLISVWVFAMEREGGREETRSERGRSGLGNAFLPSFSLFPSHKYQQKRAAAATNAERSRKVNNLLLQSQRPPPEESLLAAAFLLLSAPPKL